MDKIPTLIHMPTARAWRPGDRFVMNAHPKKWYWRLFCWAFRHYPYHVYEVVRVVNHCTLEIKIVKWSICE